MRSEQQMFDLILNYAKEDERVRVVGMEGSRVNPNVNKDRFQDYDISFLVTDMQSYLENHDWVDVFGRRIIMQMPEAMSLFPPTLGNWFSYLMLFDDGNRIDLTLIPIAEKDKYLKDGDGLLQILLDKDKIVGELPLPSDRNYHIQVPTKVFYDDCCNEFFWISTNVAKGLWRRELLFANYHLADILRSCLLQMLEWQVGVETDFSLSVGKNYKYLDRYLTEDSWNKLVETYNLSNYEHCWESLYQMTELFKEVALFVASELDFPFPIDEYNRVLQYLNKVHLDSLSS